MTTQSDDRGFRPIEDDAALDGNAAGGMLAAAMGVDMTAHTGSCAHCGTVNAVAALRAYLGGPGAVLRCPACSNVVVVVVDRPGGPIVERSAWRTAAG